MINAIADKMLAMLGGLEKFRTVEQTITKKALQTPPGAVLFLAYDREDTDNPETRRELGWDVLLLVPARGIDQGNDFAGDCIDAVRMAFIGWRPYEGGCLPAKVPAVHFEGIERGLQIYTARVTMLVFPAILEKTGS